MKVAGLLPLLIRLLALACALSLLGYLGRYFFLFEQIDSFRIQYFIVAAFALPLALIYRRWIAAVTLLLVLTLHGSELARFFLPVSASQSTTTFRVMSVNLLASNSDSSILHDEFKELQPDIIVFQEYTSRWHNILTSILSSYPYRVHEIIDSPFGIAVYSRFPYKQKQINYFNQKLSPAVDVQFEFDSQSVRILGIHPIPPMSSATYKMRNRLFEDVVAEVAVEDSPMLVVGDFNATPWSYHFKKLLKDAKLISSRDGYGLHPTWPGSFWPLWTPIDHIVHNEKIELIRFDSGERFGSDHTPVWADVAATHE